jgi:abortive infection bacteriophage resistance protein
VDVAGFCNDGEAVTVENIEYMSAAQRVSDLKQEGLLFEDESFAVRKLESIGQQRLKAYWVHYYRRFNPNSAFQLRFLDETYFEDVIADYEMDSQLRHLVAQALEIVELNLRSAIALNLQENFQAFGTYEEAFWLPKLGSLSRSLHKRVLENKRDYPFFGDWEKQQLGFVLDLSEDNPAVEEHKRLAESVRYPIWLVVEAISFTQLSKMFSGMADRALVEKIADRFRSGLPSNQDYYRTDLLKIVRHLSWARNIVAHHGRLWNQEMPKNRYEVPRKLKASISLDSRHQIGKTYDLLVVLADLVTTLDPQNTWPKSIFDFSNSQSEYSLRGMGFPQDWESRGIWAK